MRILSYKNTILRKFKIFFKQKNDCERLYNLIYTNIVRKTIKKGYIYVEVSVLLKTKTSYYTQH